MTDTERGLLRATLSDPADDTPRLVYADWLDENGRPERAEFVRVQVELARRFRSQVVGGNSPTHECIDCGALWSLRADRAMTLYWSLASAKCGQCCDNVEMTHQIRELTGEELELFRREKALRDLRHPDRTNEHLADSWFLGGRVVTHGAEGPIWWYPPAPDGATGYEIALKRGFVSAITLDADVWLRHADALYWHPEQTAECAKCGGEGYDPWIDWPASNECPACRGTGRAPRPFVPTAQPIEEVTLTTPIPASPEWCAVELFRPNLDAGHTYSHPRWPGVTFRLPVVTATNAGLYEPPVIHYPPSPPVPPGGWAIEVDVDTFHVTNAPARQLEAVTRRGRLSHRSAWVGQPRPAVGERHGPVEATDATGRRWRCEVVVTRVGLDLGGDPELVLEAMSAGPIAPIATD